MYCRLGFAVKKGQVISSEQLHPTWKNAPSVNRLKYVLGVSLLPKLNRLVLIIMQSLKHRSERQIGVTEYGWIVLFFFFLHFASSDFSRYMKEVFNCSCEKRKTRPVA